MEEQEITNNEVQKPEGYEKMSEDMKANYDNAMKSENEPSHKAEPDVEPTAEPKPDVEPTAEPKPEYNFTEFGEDITDFNTAKNKYQEISKKYQESKTFKEKFEKQAEKISKMRGAYEDERFMKLDLLAKKDPDKVPLYTQLLFNPDTMKPIDLVKMDLISRYPKFKEDENKLNTYINNLYSLGMTIDDDLSDIERAEIERKINMGEVKLEIDSAEIKKSLMANLEELDIPEKLDKEKEKLLQQQKFDEVKKQWNPIIKGLLDKFEEFPIKTKDKNGKLQDFVTHKISGDKSVFQENVVNYLTSNNLPFEADTVNKAVNFIQSQYLLNNFTDIVQTIIEHTRSISEEDYHAKYHNPTKPETNRSDGGDNVEETPFEKSKRLMMERTGVQ